MNRYHAKTDASSSHGQITRIVREFGRGPVLDVGAAQGILGQMLADARLEIDAIEPNPDWARAARPYYRNVFNCAIETTNGLHERYGLIICGDVLEHTVDPAAALRKLRRYAADDATFIVSLPNVAHVLVRLLLLFGRFPRMSRGILDRTHLHFFTRDTAEQLLREAGLRVARASGTPIPLDFIWPRMRGSRLLRLAMRAQSALVRLLPRLFAYQWVFVARADASTPPR
jgi:2-polyprenyl-3-methyl-5-hydroxy-6-metoxy-1,4-benzoquinol methylase